MKLKIIKYIGKFGGAEARGVTFPKNVPTLVNDAALFEALLVAPDFQECTHEELIAYESGAPVLPAPAPVLPAPVAPLLIAPNPLAKESK